MSMAVGMPARIELDAANLMIEGHVVRVSPAVDPNTRTLEAEVQIANPDGKLRSGTYGRAFIRLALHSGAIVVPVAAVQINSSGQAVWVAKNDQVTKRIVTVGTEVDRGQSLEIVSGLTVGEQVVIAGADGLSDGSKVRVRTQNSLESRPVEPAGSANAGAIPTRSAASASSIATPQQPAQAK